MNSNLPPQSTKLERAIERAIDSRFNSLPCELDKLWNPETCPLKLLPWLAWSMSVDVWDDNWTEAEKRDVIRHAFWIHRHKGTIGAVRRALAVLNIGLTVTEWFEDASAPYTFRLDAYAENIFAVGGGINQSLLNQIAAQIDHIKPARAHYHLRIGEHFEAQIYARTAVRQKLRQHGTIDPMPRSSAAPSPVYLRNAQRARFCSRITHDILRKAA